jgi:EAL domain-containing protein (putative c-di-GMP-specific phosphodiesterase class I)
VHHPQRLAAYAAFRDAIEAGELRVHFQPKVALRSGDIRGMEALVRWQRPDRLVLPAEFISLAERTGLIEPLTWYVLDTALDQVQRWGEHIPVAVNLSARLLRDPDLPDQVRERLRRAALPGEALELEVTESAVMANTGEAMRILSQLRQSGVRVSVDDFGTGHSSLAYLRQLPVDHLKIDRSFVHDIAVNPRDASIVRSVIDLGHTLGLELIAEGVEDAATRDVLIELGCDQGQGFFLGPPAAVD